MKFLQLAIPRPVSAFLLLLVVSFGFLAMVVWSSLEYKWPALIGSAHADPVFADLRSITSNADCFQLESWAVGSTDCDPWSRAYNYPSQLPAILSFLGLGYEDTGVIGVVLSAAFIASWALMVFLTRPTSLTNSHVLINALFLFSPPVLLAIERANSDLLIFSLLVLISFLLLRGLRFFGGGFLVVASSLKLFPLGAIIALLFIQKRKRLLWTTVVLGSALLALALNFNEWLVIARVNPQPGIETGFGASVLFAEFFSTFSIDIAYLARICGAGAFAVAVVIVWRYVERNSSKKLSQLLERLSADLVGSRAHLIVFAVGIGATLSAYILGTSWDYRLIMLLMPIAALSGASPFSESRRTVTLSVSLLVMYLSYPLPLVFQFIGDVLMFFVFCVAGVIVLKGVVSEQGLGHRSRSTVR